VILSDPKVEAVLFNIFGGITRCDEVARGLVTAFGEIEVKVPFVVRLDGTNDQEGRKIIADADLPNVHVEKTMLGAAARVVELAGDAAPTPPETGERPQPVGAATADSGTASQADVSGTDQAGAEAGGGTPRAPSGAEPTR
jgi:CoA-ligase